MKTLLLLVIVILLIVLIVAVATPNVSVQKDRSVRYSNIEVWRPEPTPENIVKKLLPKP